MLPEATSKDGGNTPPVLEWEDVPAGTAEIALVCEDPDAPGGTFLHWLVTGIPPNATRIGGGEFPEGATQARNDFGHHRWDGPRPPAGDDAHRYLFRLYAASEPLHLDAESTSDDLRDSLRGRELAHGQLVGRYRR
ncbi:YbhB/YbcL family Raf kinase inhibitor-like protein [Saccharopolyspora taberi]|uniref:YbhB/YbcL family Raf kinase inhibitor-like protein n=2 Tax=Saccharopolyspora taberi TaxID=60895 RepID=A0ABN3VDX8_9PSEU